MLRQIFRIIRSKQGQGVVEFALIAPVLLWLLFGIVEFGRILNQQLVVSEAAREGARAYAVSATGTAVAAATTAINNIQTGLGPPNASILADTPSAGFVTVSVPINVPIYTPGVGAIVASIPGQTSSNFYTATGKAVMATENGN